MADAKKVMVTITNRDGEVLQRSEVEATYDEGPKAPCDELELAMAIMAQIDRSHALIVNDD